MVFLCVNSGSDESVDLQKIARNSLQVRTLSPKDFQKELKDALEEDEKQIVAGDDQVRSDEAGQRKGRTLLSKHNQRVDAETRATRIGKFKNVLKEGVADEAKPSVARAKPSVARANPSVTQAKKLFELTPNTRDEEWKFAENRNTGRLRAPASVTPTVNSGEGFSASEDYIKDVAIGANTLLNTQEYRFYGFYERIREKLSYQWQRNLDSAFQQIINSKRNLTAGEQITRVQVKLTASGELNSVRIIGSSGFEELDLAATEAFQKAAPFPNPPHEMMKAGDNLQIHWDFVVLADENSGVRVRVQQGAW